MKHPPAAPVLVPPEASEKMAIAVPSVPAVNGFLNLYKPAGITSMDAVRRVKRITRQRRKVGHAGTLDPLAEGVLPVCFGQGTRLMEQVVSGWKRYRMTVRLGAVSDTYDAEGDVTIVADPSGLTRSRISAALFPMVGEIEQLPPMYSAVKVGGRRLYDLARAGREAIRPPRRVSVRSIAIDAIELPHLRLTVECGKGTYLRSMAHDLGEALGCGGYVAQLARLSCGGFLAQDGVTLEMLEETGPDGGWLNFLRPVDWALLHLPAIRLDTSDSRSVTHGQAIRPGGSVSVDVAEQVRAYHPDGAFLAILRREPNGMLQPTRVFGCDAPSPYAPSGGG